MLKNLVGVGLSRIDAEVYVFLATKGSQKARKIAEALKMSKQQLYRTLRKLQDKGIVHSSGERPATFSAVHIEKVIDLLIEANLEEAQQMEENREKILSLWRSMMKGNSPH